MAAPAWRILLIDSFPIADHTRSGFDPLCLVCPDSRVLCFLRLDLIRKQVSP
jgi:hypothetical protein